MILKKGQLTSNMDQSLISLLLPEYRRRILELLLLNPTEPLHGREIARRTDLPAGATTRELSKLAQAGLLTRTQRGNQQIYQANPDCPIFHELSSILLKTSGIAALVSEAIAPLGDEITLGFIFGSTARNQATAASDIDLMLIGPIRFERAIEHLWPAQTKLRREINPVVLTVPEFKARANDAFLLDILSKPKIFLKGGEYELAKLGGHQPGAD